MLARAHPYWLYFVRDEMRAGFQYGGRRVTEGALVGRIERGAWRGKTAGLRLGMGDDAALFAPKNGYQTILTCDWFLEGVHFLQGKHPADAVGWKCLARAVSDIAAMGGVPRCFLLGLALPATRTGRWLDEFLGGLRRAATRFSCALAGGDTTRSERILVHITVVGEVRRGRAVLRSGARPGDVIFVSGRLGEAEIGLNLLRRGKSRGKRNDPLLRKHLYPEARLALGNWLAKNRLATAMMDLSDGLSTDLARLCAASGTGARIDPAKIPLSRARGAVRKLRLDPMRLALHGGDDYELLFAVRKSRGRRIPRSFRGLPITAIGEITAQREVVLVGEDGRTSPLQRRGWDPFSRK